MAEMGPYYGVELKNKYVNIGKAPFHQDAILKVTGRGKFAQDIKLPGMLWGKVLRSPYAHAIITRIDISKAQALKGVVAVLTYADCQHMQLLGIPPMKPIFVGAAGQKVRFVGDAVAAVAAEIEEIAEEALKLIEVEYRQLPAVLDPEAALKPDAPLVYAEGNLRTDAGLVQFSPDKYTWIYEGGDRGNGFTEKCDIEQGFKDADFTFEFVSCNGNVPCMRTQADTCVAQFDNDKLTIWAPTMMLSITKMIMEHWFNLPASAVRVVSQCSGGGFGGANEPWFELTLQTVLLAKKAGRPVKLVSTERELLILANHVERGPSYVKVGARNDGTITALDITHYSDLGAVNCNADWDKYRWPIASLFRPQNLRYKCISTYTNTSPGGYMRGPGCEDIISIVEEAAMRVSEHIGMSPDQYHTRFCPTAGYIMPPAGRASPLPNERWASSTSYPEDIQEVIKAIGWKEKYHPAGKGPLYDGCKKRGVGMSLIAKGFSSFFGHHITIKILKDGSIKLLFGTSNCGMQTGTGICQIAAEVLGVTTADIELIWGDTDKTPYGSLHGGSSALVGAGMGAIIAAKSAKSQLLDRAASILDVTAGELEISSADNVFVKNNPEKKTTIKNVMDATWPDSQDIVADGVDDGSEEKKKRNSYMLWSSAARAYEVEVDIETGLIKVLNHAVSFNVGNAIHPKVLEGQASSGHWQGGWRTLYEDEVLDPHTGVQLVISSVERQYTTMIDEPPLYTPVFRTVPEPLAPYGACAISESVLIGTRAAITAAVYNAIGVWVKPPPLTPDKVLKALGKI